MSISLKEIWVQAENLGYAPSIMATPGHVAGNYLAHLFDKNGCAVQMNLSDGAWADTPENALLQLVNYAEKQLAANLSTNSNAKTTD